MARRRELGCHAAAQIAEAAVAASGHFLRSSRKQQEGGKAASERFGVRALRAKKPASLESSARFQGKYFWFWSSKTKMRSRLRPSRLPAFLFSRKGFGTSGQLDGSPRRSFI